MGCKYRVMDKCIARDNIKDAFCFGKDGCPYYEKEDAPTVEAIPKDQYEARLKADMVAILDEFDLRLYEQYDDTDLIKVKYVRQAIQQKINALKGDQEGEQ